MLQARFVVATPGYNWLAALIVVVAGAAAVILAVLRAARWSAPARGAREGTSGRFWPDLWVELESLLRASGRLALPMLAVGALALLVGPAVWATSALAGPANGAFPIAGPGVPLGFGTVSQADAGLQRYLLAHRGHAYYLFATLKATPAAPYIIATGQPVMALGGFTGSDPILTLGGLHAAIAGGQVRYFLLTGADRAARTSTNAQLTQWVAANCAPVAASAYDGTAASTAASGGAAQLYDCAAAANVAG